mmetsp:Transcript_80729/g.214310  ORF Transcript_80729/g.214310 Transcript_80729/m.214310 type:complete len:200 (+) Transcript_80729:89-688(+)
MVELLLELSLESLPEVSLVLFLEPWEPLLELSSEPFRCFLRLGPACGFFTTLLSGPAVILPLFAGPKPDVVLSPEVGAVFFDEAFVVRVVFGARVVALGARVVFHVCQLFDEEGAGDVVLAASSLCCFSTSAAFLVVAVVVVAIAMASCNLLERASTSWWITLEGPKSGQDSEQLPQELMAIDVQHHPKDPNFPSSMMQ